MAFSSLNEISKYSRYTEGKVSGTAHHRTKTISFNEEKVIYFHISTNNQLTLKQGSVFVPGFIEFMMTQPDD